MPGFRSENGSVRISRFFSLPVVELPPVIQSGFSVSTTMFDSTPKNGIVPSLQILFRRRIL
jgi:hypothetical protein